MSPTETVEYVQGVEPASGDWKNPETGAKEPFVVNPSTILRSDDPLVKQFPHLFKALETSRQRPAVEQATAAPGEKRGASRQRRAS